MNRDLTVACSLVLISEKARFWAERCGQPNMAQSLYEIDQHAKTAISILRQTETKSWSKCPKCASDNAIETVIPSSSKFVCRACGTGWIDHYGGER